jgi:hypothetical protein
MQQPMETILHDGDVAVTAHARLAPSMRLGMVMIKSDVGADGEGCGEVVALAGTGARGRSSAAESSASRLRDARVVDK